jgi:hypothetical protein
MIDWAEKSAEYRLRALMDLREMAFGNSKDQSIKKVVYKRSLHEEVKGADISKLGPGNNKK